MWAPDTPPILDRAFYARSALQVAPDLLGCTLVRSEPNGSICAGVIVETEAYTWDDPACHAFRGETARCRVMFGEPGNAYVYFTYGMHYCFNVVTSELGRGEAVLVRAVEPRAGEDLMLARRVAAAQRPPRMPSNFLTGGPARLCQAFAIDVAHSGVSLVGDSDIVVHYRPAGFNRPISATARIGISRAKDNLWRFILTNSIYLSR